MEARGDGKRRKKEEKRRVCSEKNDRRMEDGVDGGGEANVASEQEKER